jgi:hypothetical protein
MQYYLKKCGFQELGSVRSDGKAHRGRYLLTSMNKDVLSMFPPLSEIQKNDSALLPIITLYSGKKVYCNYIYHNDKFHGSTAAHPRNEYRIYLNKELENGQLLFAEGDILIFRKHEIENEESEKQTVYYMDLLKDTSSMIYKACNDMIKSSPINGGYAFYEGIISEFEDKVIAIKGQGETSIAIDKTVTNKVMQDNTIASMAGLFNPVTFRDFVMVGYEHLCAVTRTVIKYNTYTNLEAAHIMPKSHGGLFLPSNGLALTRDVHWAFDKGFFTLDDDMRMIVHEKVESTYLQSFNKKTIYLPQNTFFLPDLNNMRYHRENVYGLFLTTGRL